MNCVRNFFSLVDRLISHSRPIFFLENNIIKFINGDAFHRLHRLKKVHLDGNICIDESFKNPTRIAAMPQILTHRCGLDKNTCYNGAEREITRIIAELADAVNSKCHCNNEMLLAELKAKNSEIKLLEERIQTFSKDPTGFE